MSKSNCKQNQETMPIALAPLVGAGLGALQQSKIDKALAGQKTYSAPKTIFGKLIGGVSGRSAAAEATAQSKSSPLSGSVLNSLKSSAVSAPPISGGISFGGEASRKTYLPFAIVAAVIAAFYFMRKKGSRRRR